MNPEPSRRKLRLPNVHMPLVWACGLALVLTAALVSVRSALHTETGAPPDWRDVERSRQLEALSRELTRLLHELEQAPPAASVAERARWETHVANDLQPRVSDFRHRLLAAPLDGPAYDALLRASDRLGAAAANPGDARALDAAARARENVQTLMRGQSAAQGG